MDETLNPPSEPPLSKESHGENPFSVSPLIEYYHPPRLRIIHLLGWVTLGMVLIKFSQAKCAYLFDNSQPYALSNKINTACESILQAALLVGGIVIFTDLFRRKEGLFQPGHWIVLVFSCITIREILGIAIIPHGGITDRSVINLFCWEQAIFLLFMYLLLLFAIIRIAERGYWKALLILLACRFVIDIAENVLNVFVDEPVWDDLVYWRWRAIILASVSFIVGGIDVARGLRRDWLHWLGIAYLASVNIQSVVNHVIVSWFNSHS